MPNELNELTGNPETQEPVQPQSEEPEVQSPVTEEEPEFSLDEEGELRIADTTEKPKEAEYYTPEEIRDIGIDKLDPKKIPPELVPFYKSMQGDYTRKTQLLREREKELESSRMAAQPMPQQEIPQQPQMSEKEAQDLFFKTAKQRAASMLGVDEKDFDEYDARHMSYLSIASQELYSMAQQEMARQAHVQQKRNQYNELLGRLRQEEPHYDEINQWAASYIENLPYKEYSKYMRTFQQGDIEEIETAIQSIRKAWYQNRKAAAPKETPPPVETGSASDEEPKKRLTTKAFAAMSDDDRVEFLKANGYVS